MAVDRPSRERTRASLELLYSIGRELTAQLDLGELLKRVLQLTLENIGGQSGSILVLDEEGNVTEGAIALGGRVLDHTAEQLAYTYERGLAGWVVGNRQAALIGNTDEDERWVDRAGEGDSDGRSAISVPLIARDRVVGALTTSHPMVGRLNQDDLELLTAIADQAGIAIENARLFTAEQERRKFASTLQEIARVISSTLEPELVFEHVLNQLARVVEYDSASIFLVEGKALRLAAARGVPDEEELIGLTIPLENGMIDQRLIDSQEPLVVDDVQQEPGWLQTDDLPTSHDIRGWIGAPLVYRDRVVGVLNVDSHEPGAYGSDEMEVVSAFADHAATAVANARLFAETQRQVRATSALAVAARVVTASLDLDDVLDRILEQTVRTLDVESASLALLDQETGELEFKVARGGAAEEVVGFRLEPGQGIAGWVAEHGEAAAVNQVRNDPRFFPGLDRASGFRTRSVACAPIQVQDRLIGVLEAVNSRHNDFNAEHLDQLMGIASLAGTAIVHAQLFAESQSARERYAGLFNDSIDPILITDLLGEISEANERAIEFLGYPHHALIGRSMLELHQEASPDRRPQLAEMTSGEAHSYTSSVRRRDGVEVPVEIHVKRLALEGEPSLQWILHDISERKELDELRADLTSMIFHDLRSPLGNVMSSLEMLQNSLPDDGTLQSVLAIAIRSSRRLSRLVESLLDLGQLELGQAVLHKDSADLGAIVKEAVEEVRPIASAKDHELTFEVPEDDLRIEMDIDMIRRVVINLLENAVKYTRSGGEIRAVVASADGEVQVRIIDTGPGISVEDQARLFRKFSRIHHEGRPKGLGLGLAFCRMAVEAHGGRIWVESEVGEGSSFQFALPR